MTGPKPAPEPQEPLPDLHSPRTPPEVIDRLATASKRGRLAGFRRLPGAEGGEGGEGLAFEFDAFATPFEYSGIGTVTPEGAGSRVSFALRARRRMPIIAAVILVVTLWPGLPLTESMIDTYWAWHRAHVQTWWWYVPMWVLCLPWMWSSWKKSRRDAEADARKTIAKISQELR